jgi:hypothetical protein
MRFFHASGQLRPPGRNCTPLTAAAAVPRRDLEVWGPSAELLLRMLLRIVSASDAADPEALRASIACKANPAVRPQYD